MTFAQRRNRLTTHFSERIPVVKRRISVLIPLIHSALVRSQRSAYRPATVLSPPPSGAKVAAITIDGEVVCAPETISMLCRRNSSVSHLPGKETRFLGRPAYKLDARAFFFSVHSGRVQVDKGLLVSWALEGFRCFKMATDCGRTCLLQSQGSSLSGMQTKWRLPCRTFDCHLQHSLPYKSERTKGLKFVRCICVDACVHACATGLLSLTGPVLFPGHFFHIKNFRDWFGPTGTNRFCVPSFSLFFAVRHVKRK
jgi:hypothetical protein